MIRLLYAIVHIKKQDKTMVKVLGRRSTQLSDIAHVIYNGKHYVISSSYVTKETLIFSSNKEGHIVSYDELGAAQDISDGIENFKDCLHSWANQDVG